MKPVEKTYEVYPIAQPILPDADWNKPAWRPIPPLDVNCVVGDRPAHIPAVQAKLAYDSTFIYVIFHVQDRYVRAVATCGKDPVCQDSCVEFFFTPCADNTTPYFNIEINCGGTMLFKYQPGKFVWLADAEYNQVQIAASMPRRVDPEIPDPVAWTVEYRFPFEILSKYRPIENPAPGVLWRANLYKCADHTSHPHWLCWSPIDLPQPKFHVPQFFGTLKFR